MKFFLINRYSWLLLTLFSIFSALADETKGAKRVTAMTGDGASIELYQQSHALLIGVSDYTAGWPDLENIPSELEHVEALLSAQGFNVINHLNPNSDQLENAFEDFIDEYGFEPDNRLLFFFSGHGHSLDNGNAGYLVPTDAPDPNKNERGFRRKALTMNQILTWSRDMKAKHALFLFDSCFSGTVFKARNLPKVPPSISRLTALPVRQYITAGSAGQTVPAKSTFTPMFVDALRYQLGDLNQDGYVTGLELGLYLRDTLPNHVENQSPQFGPIRDYELSRGDFVFSLASTQSSVVPKTSTISTPTSSASQRSVPTSTPQNILTTGQVIQDKLIDDSVGPKMVFIKGGCFQMGSPSGETDRSDDETQHKACVDDFYIGQYEVTFAEYDWFVAATGSEKPSDEGWGSGDRPVINVSWDNGVAYAKWLSEQTDESYRLPTEAEWEYASRAGSETTYWWGDDLGKNNANCDGCGSKWDDQKTAPVGSFKSNPWGLYDTSGNVYEWVQDRYGGYDASVVNNPTGPAEGDIRVLRGGSWLINGRDARSADRNAYSPGTRNSFIGFRLARGQTDSQ